MTVAGGIRARLIRDSLYDMIKDSLTALGWFDGGRRHQPLNMIHEQIENLESIQINTLALADEDLVSDDIELGSNLAEHRWHFYVDFYAESDTLGVELIRDVADILSGRMSSIGRSFANFGVYDFRQATPPLLFFCEIENVRVDRSQNWNDAHLRHWYMVDFDVVDVYSDDS